jgi:hypothetical protein
MLNFDEDHAIVIGLLTEKGLVSSRMHSGNLGLFVELEDLAEGRFTLAPVYDMLSMRWRPNPVLGDAPEYQPFDVEGSAATSVAGRRALDFWQRLARSGDVSAAMARLATEMAARLAAVV